MNKHCLDMSPHEPHLWGDYGEIKCPGTEGDEEVGDSLSIEDVKQLRDMVEQGASWVRHGVVGLMQLSQYAVRMSTIAQEASKWAEVVVIDPKLRRDIKDLARQAKEILDQVDRIKYPS